MGVICCLRSIFFITHSHVGPALLLPTTSKQGLRVHCGSLDSGLCQCDLRSGASFKGVLMFLTDYLLKYFCPHSTVPVCVCTEPHPAKKGKKTLDVFTAGSSQIWTNLYCQWHQILHHLPSLETPNGSPRPWASCRHGVWNMSIWM